MGAQLRVSNDGATIRFAPLAVFLAISFGTLALGGWLTYLGMGPWYDSLRIPDWQPPGWVFTPVWTLLLTALAFATWIVFLGERTTLRTTALRLYAVQIVMNVAWSLLFFALHSPTLALVDIMLLDCVLVAMIIVYARTSWIAGALIVPYGLWLFLATAINLWIVWNN